MSCLAVMRGSKTEISNAPVVDGQLFIEIDQVGTQNLSGYNGMYIDNENQRFKLGINDWSGILNKPFESVGDTLATAEDKLSIHTEWDRLTNKPLEEIGYGFNIDENKILNMNIEDLNYGQYENEIALVGYTYGWEYIEVNNVEHIINNQQYAEQTVTLDTDEDNIIIFYGDELDMILSSRAGIEVYSSIWNFYPKKIEVKNNICTITFPKYNVPNTDLTCRIYIKEV